MQKNLKIIVAILILFSCTSQIKLNKEKEIDILNESTVISMATHIFEAEGMIGFLISDLEFCYDDVEYRFQSFDFKGRLIEEGIYQGIGRVPYFVELTEDAFYVLIYKD